MPETDSAGVVAQVVGALGLLGGGGGLLKLFQSSASHESRISALEARDLFLEKMLTDARDTAKRVETTLGNFIHEMKQQRKDDQNRERDRRP